MTDIWGEEYTSYVGCMGLEGSDGNEGSNITVLNHTPDIDVAL